MSEETRENEEKEPEIQNDLDFCPRCGAGIEDLIWGQTNCPNCGLHFECCELDKQGDTNPN